MMTSFKFCPWLQLKHKGSLIQAHKGRTFCSVSGGHVISRICPPRKVCHFERENALWSGHGRPFISFFSYATIENHICPNFWFFLCQKKQQKLSEENQWLRTSCNLWILCKHWTWLNLLVDIAIIETRLSSKFILLMAFYFVNTSLPPTLMRSTTTYMSMQGMASCLIQCCLFSSFLQISVQNPSFFLNLSA
jgi:hypothetical protein